MRISDRFTGGGGSRESRDPHAKMPPRCRNETVKMQDGRLKANKKVSSFLGLVQIMIRRGSSFLSAFLLSTRVGRNKRRCPGQHAQRASWGRRRGGGRRSRVPVGRGVGRWVGCMATTAFYANGHWQATGDAAKDISESYDAW